MSTDDHGRCPHCDADMNGEYIWDTFAEKHGDAEADRIAEMYGASKGHGRWGRQIGRYCTERDRTIGHTCPDCGKDF